MSFSDHQSASISADRHSMDSALNNMTEDRNNTIRRRPPTAPYPASSYGSYEGDSLLRYAPYSDHDDAAYFSRRRVPVAWYKQPQKLIMVATLAWIGGVMYLANLAHAILRSQKSQVMSSPMGSSGGSKDQVNVRFGMENYADKDSDYKQWLDSQNGYGMENSNYADQDSDYEQWLDSQKGYDTGNYYADKDQWTESRKYQKSSTNTNNEANVNVRFGKGRSLKDASFEEWLQYQENNKVKYEANGKYGQAQPAPEMLQSDATQEASVPAALLDSSVSTIDWPMKMGLTSPSCTTLNGCSPSNNVTILVVYGPEYHTHISEMAWHVATGVVSFL
jgi:hypothetical protein